MSDMMEKMGAQGIKREMGLALAGNISGQIR